MKSIAASRISTKARLGGLLVPGEGILCTFSVPLAYATQAVVNGVELFVNFRVKEITTSPSKRWTMDDR